MELEPRRHHLAVRLRRRARPLQQYQQRLRPGDELPGGDPGGRGGRRQRDRQADRHLGRQRRLQALLDADPALHDQRRHLSPRHQHQLADGDRGRHNDRRQRGVLELGAAPTAAQTGAGGCGLNKELINAHANLIWNPVPFADIGLEYTWAHRVVVSNLKGDMNALIGRFRVQFDRSTLDTNPPASGRRVFLCAIASRGLRPTSPVTSSQIRSSPSPPRKRGSRASGCAVALVPAFAGMTIRIGRIPLQLCSPWPELSSPDGLCAAAALYDGDPPQAVSDRAGRLDGISDSRADSSCGPEKGFGR